MRNEPQQRQPRRFRQPTRISINPLLVLIAINAILYIVTSLKPNVELDFAFIPALIGERPWTLITSMFIHASVWHLLFNMLALFIFGRLLRRFIGDNTFLLVYFVGGLAGNLLFWAINAGDYVAVVGASGAIYAIAGAIVVLVPNLRIALYGIIPMPMWVFVLVFMVILSFLGPGSATVAWEGHLGGLAAGLIFGFFFRRRLKFMIY